MIGTDHNDFFLIDKGDVAYIDTGAGDDVVLVNSLKTLCLAVPVMTK